MRSSWSVAMLVVAVAVGGYAAGSRPVLAQADPLPYAVGDRVMFTHPGGGSQNCQIEEVRGLFVRCGPRYQGRASWTNVSAMLAVDVTVPK
jgi:hypothetical protein